MRADNARNSIQSGRRPASRAQAYGQESTTTSTITSTSTPVGLELYRSCFEKVRRISASQGDISAGTSQLDGNGSTYARPAAGDQGNLRRENSVTKDQAGAQALASVLNTFPR